LLPLSVIAAHRPGGSTHQGWSIASANGAAASGAQVSRASTWATIGLDHYGVHPSMHVAIAWQSELLQSAAPVDAQPPSMSESSTHWVHEGWSELLEEQ
jgi:hypothetical protein